MYISRIGEPFVLIDFVDQDIKNIDNSMDENFDIFTHH